VNKEGFHLTYEVDGDAKYEIDPCDSCANGAKCYLSKCICAAGWMGPSCEDVDPCYQVKCLHGGTCAEGKCVCPEPFHGTQCQACSATISGESGAFTSPQYPEGVYDDDIECTYTVALPQPGPHTVTINMDYNVLKAYSFYNQNCSSIFVRVGDNGKHLCGEGTVSYSASVAGSSFDVFFSTMGTFRTLVRGFSLDYNLKGDATYEPVKSVEL